MHSSERHIDDTLRASFPASNPPSRTLGYRDGSEDGRAAASCELFLREHQNTAQLLALLKHELEAMSSSATPDYGMMIDVLHYLSSYVDRYHHAREEAAFAVAVRRAPRLAERVAAVTGQHSNLVGAGAPLIEGLERVQMDLPVPTSHLLADGAWYISELRSHMSYEENHLFPHVCRLLTEADWNAIDAEYGIVCDPLFGPDVQGRYRALFERLTRAAGCDCSYR